MKSLFLLLTSCSHTVLCFFLSEAGNLTCAVITEKEKKRKERKKISLTIYLILSGSQEAPVIATSS